MKTLIQLGSILGIVVLCAGCGVAATTGETPATATEVPVTANETPPDIRGAITNIQQADAQGAGQGYLGTAMVEGPLEGGTKFDKASVRITNQTRLLEKQGEERRTVTMDALVVGQRVEAWFTGPVAESYPVQATAIELVILK